jgi:hypothetical protein
MNPKYPSLVLISIKMILSSLLIFSVIYEHACGADKLSLLIPEAPKGWIESGAPQIYNRQNLFDYIDGGAEVYLAYDFQKLVVQEYIPETQDSLGENSITVEIWQMKSSADAYGVFSLDQEGERVRIGQNGVYSDGFLRFWKDVFFVKILAMGGSSKETILNLGNQFDKKIKKEGELPQLIFALPSDNLVAGSVRFFHKKIILSDLYYFYEQNILSLYSGTDCAFADYKIGNDSLKLLLVQYPDTIMTARAKANMKSVYLEKGAPAESKIFKTSDGKLVGMDMVSNYLILVFEGKNENNISWLLDRVRNSLDHSIRLEQP